MHDMITSSNIQRYIAHHQRRADSCLITSPAVSWLIILQIDEYDQLVIFPRIVIISTRADDPQNDQCLIMVS
jgi:hypothetical protein